MNPAVPSNMRLVPLAPYSPQLNPAEHVWEYIRENHTRNQVFDDLEQAMDTVETSLHRLHEMPEMLRSMTAFPWILEPAAFDVGAFVDQALKGDRPRRVHAGLEVQLLGKGAYSMLPAQTCKLQNLHHNLV